MHSSVLMDEVEIIGTFESEETARTVARALNTFFTWLVEGDRDDVPAVFEDFGIAAEDYLIDPDDIDWPEPPRARARGAKLAVTLETATTTDTISELIEALGAFDVVNAGEDEDEED
jgi:hypothetical protein